MHPPIGEPMTKRLEVVGGGLAGCEAAWQAAERGVPVRLYEMRPKVMTPAHTGDCLAELVCSNSLGSDLPDRAGGVLKAELRDLESVVMASADAVRVPARRRVPSSAAGAPAPQNSPGNGTARGTNGRVWHLRFLGQAGRSGA